MSHKLSFGCCSVFVFVLGAFLMNTPVLAQDLNFHETTKEMFQGGNKNFIVVQALQDGLLKFGAPYRLEYKINRVLLNGQELPEPFRLWYLSLVRNFNIYYRPYAITTLRGEGIVAQDVKNPMSAFRRADSLLIKQWQANLYKPSCCWSDRTVEHAMVQDGVIDSVKGYEILYNKKGLFVNGRALSGELEAKYKQLYAEVHGFYPAMEGYSHSSRKAPSIFGYR